MNLQRQARKFFLTKWYLQIIALPSIVKSTPHLFLLQHRQFCIFIKRPKYNYMHFEHFPIYSSAMLIWYHKKNKQSTVTPSQSIFSFHQQETPHNTQKAGSFSCLLICFPIRQDVSYFPYRPYRHRFYISVPV